MLLALWMMVTAVAEPDHRGFLGPGGVVAAGHHAVTLTADTELTG